MGLIFFFAGGRGGEGEGGGGRWEKGGVWMVV